MKFKQMLAVSLVVVGLPLTGNWNVDATKAKVALSVDGPFGRVHGGFSGLKATIKFNEKDLSGSSISASIDAKTVSTGVSLRNSDLRNKKEWLNTDKYPRITFRSNKIEKSANGYTAIGDMTIKGITKAEEIPFSFTGKDADGLFKGQFKLKRSDYDLGKPGGSVGNIITIDLSVPVKN